MAERAGVSLRLRLIVGAAIIALVAVFAAALAAWGTATTARLIERAAAAQVRIDHLSNLSARISDYAVIAVETTRPSVPSAARAARLASQADRVESAFKSIDQALAAAVAEAERDGEAEQMRRATRSLGVARMRAQFQALVRSIDTTTTAGALRAHLDGFATQFSPLVNAAIAEEQRDRNASRQAVSRLRDRMIWLALAAGLLAAVLVGLFYFTLVRPLIAQFAHIRDAATMIGDGNFAIQLPSARSRELNWVYHALSQTADRLKAREAQVAADRADLNQIIAERTSALEQANTRLSQIDSDRRRFFADVGHELRTPLTVILAESELGLQGPDGSGDARDAMSVINARARRLNRRIDDLLRVASSESGEIQLRSEPFDLAQAAADAIADMHPLAKRRDVHLETGLDPAPAIGDADWCRQIISGLIENALKHSTGSSVIELNTGTEDQQSVMTITDDGPGLPPDEIDAVFARFAQGSRKAAGSSFGVGLALARWIVERQSGTIRLDSPAIHPPKGGTTGGPGVTVKVSLPGGCDA